MRGFARVQRSAKSAAHLAGSAAEDCPLPRRLFARLVQDHGKAYREGIKEHTHRYTVFRNNLNSARATIAQVAGCVCQQLRRTLRAAALQQ